MEVSFHDHSDGEEPTPTLSRIGSFAVENSSTQQLPAELQAKLQSDKIKTLLKQCDGLRKKMLKMEKENKDNIRVKKIKKLEAEMEEKLIVSEAFKEKLIGFGMSLKDIELIVDRALKGPAKIRPPRIEELQTEIAQLKLDKMKLEKSVDNLKKNGNVISTSRSNSSANLFSTAPIVSKPATSHVELGFMGIVMSYLFIDNRIASLMEALELAKVEIEQKNKAIDVHKDMLEQAEIAARQQKVFEEKLKRSEQKRKEVQKEAEYLHEELMNCLVLNEKYAYEIRDLSGRVSAENRPTEESRSKSRDEALAMTHSKIVSALEATVMRLSENESKLMKELTSLRNSVEESRKNNSRNNAGDLVEVRRQIEKLQETTTKHFLDSKEALNSRSFESNSISNSDRNTKSDDVLKSEFAAREAEYKRTIQELTQRVSSNKSAIQRPQTASISSKHVTLPGEVEELREKLASSQQRLAAYKQLVKDKFKMVDDLLDKHALSTESGEGNSKELATLKQDLKVSESIVMARSNEILILRQQIETLTNQFKSEKEYFESMIKVISSGFVTSVQHISMLEAILGQNEIDVPDRPDFSDVASLEARDDEFDEEDQ